MFFTGKGQQEMDSKLKPAILSLSLLTVMAGTAVSPSLGVIADVFPESPSLFIQMVVSLPAIVIIPSLFIASRLAKIFTRRQVIFAGLFVYIAGGMAGGLVNSLGMLLFSRAVLGVGVGLVMPFSTSLISDFFEGEERSRLMGLSSSSNMLGGLVALLLSGVLADISWRLPFFIYLFALPVLLLNLKYLPEPPPDELPGVKDAKLPFRVYYLAAGMLALNLAFFVLPPTIALFIKENSLGSPEITGVAISFSPLAGFAAGVFLRKTMDLTGRYHVPLMLFVMGSGFLLLHLSTVIIMVFAGTGLVGFSNRSLYPRVFNMATEGVSREQSVKVTATLSSMVYLGQFLSPLFINFLGHLFGNPSLRFNYMVVAAILFSGALIFFLRALITFKDHK